MARSVTAQPETRGGLACWRLTLPEGDSVLVAEHGAHVLAWSSGGVERLYLSPRAALDGRAAIRGGIPVCWPQFSDRGPLAKHGFVRQRRWQRAEGPALETASGADARRALPDLDGSPAAAGLDFVLSGAGAAADALPQAWRATLSVRLRPGALTVALGVDNPGAEPLAFTGALHTYLAVSDIEGVVLHGLAGRPGWDALSGASAPGGAVTRFDAEFDRVYGAPAADLRLDDPGRGLRVRQGGGWTDTVVWNPWVGKCATLADMPADGWRHMLCLEAARVFEPAVVPPGGGWSGWQTLSVD